jgi:hypothetical protein
VAIQNQATSNLTSAFNAETARAAAELSTQNSQVASANAQLSTTLSSTLASEVTRADAACASSAMSSAGAVPQQTGTNDFATWYAGFLVSLTCAKTNA